MQAICCVGIGFVFLFAPSKGEYLCFMLTTVRHDKTHVIFKTSVV